MQQTNTKKTKNPTCQSNTYSTDQHNNYQQPNTITKRYYWTNKDKKWLHNNSSINQAQASLWRLGSVILTMLHSFLSWFLLQWLREFVMFLYVSSAILIVFWQLNVGFIFNKLGFDIHIFHKLLKLIWGAKLYQHICRN